MSHAAGFCSASKNKFFVFGGTSHKFSTCVKDTDDQSKKETAMMHMLDLDTFEWDSFDSQQPSRDDFAYTYDDASETLYVFGGF